MEFKKILILKAIQNFIFILNFCQKNHLNRIFAQLLREKRSTIRTDRLGYWSGDIDYFRGYKMIDKMNTDKRKKNY